MKKKNLFFATVIAVVGVSGLVLSRENTCGAQLCDFELANIEALTQAENPLTPPCDNMTGYKKWETSDNDGVYKKEQFRDCCYKEKKGYNPTPCI